MTACPAPLAFERLVAYLDGELQAEEDGAVEEHLFGCASCTEEAARVEALIRSVRELLPPVIGRARLEQLRAEGLRIRETVVRAGEEVEVHFAGDLDVLIHRLMTPPGVHARVDLEMYGPGPDLIWAFEAIPVDEVDGVVYIACQRHLGAMGPPDMRFRLVAVHGEERSTLGEYRVNHTV